MKIRLFLEFRGPVSEVLPTVPDDLKPILLRLEDYELPQNFEIGQIANTSVLVDQNTANQILDWGRQFSNGKSNVAIANYDEVYNVDELDRNEVVEVFSQDAQEGTSILNSRKAFDAVWACECCDRINGRQIADLCVSFDANISIHTSESHQWIVSSSYVPLFEEYGLQHRLLNQKKNYVQLIIDQVFTMCADTHPLSTSRNTCPGCGLNSITRTNVAEGKFGLTRRPEMFVRKDCPISIERQDFRLLSFAQSSTNLDPRDRMDPNSRTARPHKAGKSIGGDMYEFYYGSWPLFIAKPELVKRLLEIGATGLGFRPVNILSKC